MRASYTTLLTVSILLFACNLSANAWHRCDDQAGKVTYQEQPCENSSQRKLVQPKAASTTAVTRTSSDSRAAFREMADAWRIGEIIQAQHANDVKVVSEPTMVSFVEEQLVDLALRPPVDSASGRTQVRVEPGPHEAEVRKVAKKYAPELLAQMRRDLEDVRGLVAIYEDEYTRVFSAEELRQIGTYYRTSAGRAETDGYMARGMMRQVPMVTAQMQSESRAFYESKTGQKLRGLYTQIQAATYKRHQETSVAKAIRERFLADAKRSGTVKP